MKSDVEKKYFSLIKRENTIETQLQGTMNGGKQEADRNTSGNKT